MSPRMERASAEATESQAGFAHRKAVSMERCATSASLVGVVWWRRDQEDPEDGGGPPVEGSTWSLLFLIGMSAAGVVMAARTASRDQVSENVSQNILRL